MKYFLLVLMLFNLWACTPEKNPQKIISKDIGHFWAAFDKIQTTKDSTKQLEYLNSLFLDQASIGQKAMIQARNYTAQEYLNSINQFPEFWKSIRKNTENTEAYNASIYEGIKSLKKLYPDLDPSIIYYTIGNFRSPGTGFDSLVLIGSEFALGDPQVNTTELPTRLGHVKTYHAIEPLNYIGFLNVHEYIHTQQKPIAANLLSQTLFEGIAEFLAIKATNKKSPWKAFDYGAKHEDFVKKEFEKEMFNWRMGGNWLWNSTENKFGTRDMGYFVGYKIADGYYQQAQDKQQAIKELIELDFDNEKELERIVNQSGYLSASLEKLEEQFQASRPTVVDLKPAINGEEKVSTKIKILTIEFSEALDTDFRNFDFGPLGAEAVVRTKRFIGFSEDGKSMQFEIESLKPNKQYQLTIGNGFRNAAGVPLIPYLIDFKTGK